MQVASTIKKAPKWAWYTAGGVAVGAVALRLYKSRTTSTAATDSGAAASDTGGAPDPYAYGAGGATGVIVPPVIIPPNDSTGDTAGLLGTVLGGVGDLTGLVMGSVETLIGPTQESQAGLVDIIGSTWGTLATANAGPPPTPVGSSPAPVVTPVIPPAQAPPQVPQGTGPSHTLYTCPSGYPNYNADRNDCYKTVCRSGVRWHVYKRSGDEIKVAGSKC
jgi:hypothetical protein